MAILKCKMCGGDLQIEEGMTVCECEYCGSKQTVPSVDDEKIQKLYERANKLRFACDFDKAYGIYESIINEDQNQAEAYWGLVLCKYGIEYVDDPATGKKVPTCHRSSFDSVMEDENFDQVMENADSVARSVYREQAKQIEEIRKGIIEVSGKEAPYDIFICYKETAEDGNRTIDSVIAQDVYDALTDKGYRVFFSRISLEDKLGVEYEPYIFAALNSAQIMLAFGTSYDYYNAVWVKNEWSRYLKLMEKDKTKHLIPCFKDIDAYDIPKEFAKLQAQDMGKVGAIQDLIRGIDKLTGKTDAVNASSAAAAQTVVVQQSVGPNVQALIERGNNALEDGDFEDACGFFDQVLSMDAKNAYAFLGLYMAWRELSNIKALEAEYQNDKVQLENKNLQRAIKNADPDLKSKFDGFEEKRQAEIRRIAEEKQLEAKKKKKEQEERREEIKRVIKEIRQMQQSNTDIELTDVESAEKARLEEQAAAAQKASEEAQSAYNNMPEHGEVTRLQTEIHNKQQYLSGLGLFKGKEKKEVRQQIDSLTVTIRTKKKVIEAAYSELSQILFRAEEAKTAAAVFVKNIPERRIKEQEKKLEAIAIHLFEKFGKYPQEEAGGIMPIKWRVLDSAGTKILIISEYALDAVPYNKENEDITWERCTLRKWLNNEFIKEAFDEETQKAICFTDVQAHKNPDYNTDPGNDTKDKIFLLSIDEADTFFESNEDRACKPTPYAKEHHVYTDDKENCEWWLRSPGNYSDYAAIVGDDGYVYTSGYNIRTNECDVRPALWVDLANLYSSIFESPIFFVGTE